MLTIVDERRRLRLADDHLRVAVYLVTGQEDRLARYRAAGLDTQLAGELLLAMQAILRNLVVNHRLLCDAIRDDHRALLRLSAAGDPG
ncbi:hypothetical protein AB4Y45_40890 [Paraburkholderia sp. EG287A]|uniref:hypothetical protein n=1 Tax=unclassified Paraburkholderia TaxID=2615204 RepID=UPI0034D38500